jgi:DNA helicase-2/ATP-dependent DNA helicase PcrA
MAQMFLESILEGLTPDQRKAVESARRFVRVVAGAGTGKTETLTRRILYLLARGAQPSEIVAFTFTDRAAQRIKDRIYRTVVNIGGEAEYPKLWQMSVGTIHAYCLRIMQDFFGYGNYDVLDENQEMAFVLRHARDLGIGGPDYASRCTDFLRSFNLIYDERIKLDDLRKKSPAFALQVEAYDNLLNDQRLLTFSQIISKAVDLLTSNRLPLGGVKHLLVDEYQDINRAQEELIKIIGETATVFVVGDPRQCIYQWRGSDESCFHQFTERFPDCETIQTADNWRSCINIVNLANAVASSYQQAKYEPLKAARNDKGLSILVEFETDDAEAAWVVRQARLLVERGACDYSDIAILLRSVATSGLPFIQLCRKQNVPYIVGGKVGLFQRDEAQAVGMLFAWLSDHGYWRSSLYHWQNLRRDEELLDSALRSWENVISVPHDTRSKLREWKRRARSGTYPHFTRVFQDLLAVLGFRNLDPQDKLHATVMANLGRFNKMLTDYESSIRRGGHWVDWRHVWDDLVYYMNVFAMGAYEEQPSEDIRGVNALQIMTVHQAKGLEWPVVFIPCLTNKRFPSSRAGQGSTWLVPEEMFNADRYRGGVEDERKLFYVAVTRARDVICLSYFKRIRQQMNRSQFVESITAHLQFQTAGSDIPLMQIRTPAGDEEISPFTAGEIINYMRCPYFYRLREQWNFQAGLDELIGYGRSLHHCLRLVGEAVKFGVEPQSAVSKAVADGFHLPYASPRVKQQSTNEAKRTLSHFVGKRKQDLINIEEVETRLEFPVLNASITGRVDVIMRQEPNPGLEVRDYKTSEEITTFDESSLQVRLYSLGLISLGRPITSGSLAYLDAGEVKYVDISQNMLTEAKRIAEECIQQIRRSKFPPKASAKCKCDYKAICKYAQL